MQVSYHNTNFSAGRLQLEAHRRLTFFKTLQKDREETCNGFRSLPSPNAMATKLKVARSIFCY